MRFFCFKHKFTSNTTIYSPSFFGNKGIRKTYHCISCVGWILTVVSTGPDGLLPRVLRELADALARPFSHLWKLMEIRVNSSRLEKSKCVTIFIKGQKVNPRSYRLLNTTSAPGKVTGQVLLAAISGHTNEKEIWNCEWGFTMCISGLTNLAALCNKMTWFVDNSRHNFP